MRRRPWTTHESATAFALRREGWQLQEIAEEIGRSAQAISDHFRIQRMPAEQREVRGDYARRWRRRQSEAGASV